MQKILLLLLAIVVLAAAGCQSDRNDNPNGSTASPAGGGTKDTQ